MLRSLKTHHSCFTKNNLESLNTQKSSRFNSRSLNYNNSILRQSTSHFHSQPLKSRGKSREVQSQLNTFSSSSFKIKNSRSFTTESSKTSSSKIALDSHDAVVLGVWTNPKDNTFTLAQDSQALLGESLSQFEDTQKKIQHALASSGISGKKPGETRVLYGVGELKRVGIVCLGPKKTEEKKTENEKEKKENEEKDLESNSEEEQNLSFANTLRSSVQSLLKALKSTKAHSVLFPERLADADDLQLCVAEAAELSTWKFDRFKSKKKNKPTSSGSEASNNGNEVDEDEEEDDPTFNITVVKESKEWKTGQIRAAAQNTARNLAETPSNHMTPEIFCDSVERLFSNLATRNGTVEVITRDEKWIQDENMGAMMAVNRGSDTPMRFLELHYRPIADGPTDLLMVGKGVTFDSGGISIKPSANMGLMRGDMGGAAAVVGALHGMASLEVPMNVSVVTPLCENMVDARSYKPGDVITARNGKHIEIDNTDAEGRLILADAIHYAQNKWQPHHMIDVATLTGAMVLALGNVYSGVFTHSNRLWHQLEQAGRMTNDLMWRMPMHKDYFKILKSDLADFRNAGSRGAGASSAAMFLNEFVDVKQTKWAHLDIAGTGMVGSSMTGRPTRALIQMGQLLAEQNKH